MRIIVPVKQLPDLVEELEVDASGVDIDRDFVKFVPNEWDEQALEQALLVKEAVGGEVVVVGLDEPDIDGSLYTAIARVADRAVKLAGVPTGWILTAARAAILADWLAGEKFDLVITGVQAADDLDGQLVPTLAARLGLPHASVVVDVEVKDGAAMISQELGGGVNVEESLSLPAVIGMQTARQTPRYAPISRVRQAMQSGGVEDVAASAGDATWHAGLQVRRLFPPERSGHAEMIEGSADDVAAAIIDLLRSRGLVKG